MRRQNRGGMKASRRVLPTIRVIAPLLPAEPRPPGPSSLRKRDMLNGIRPVIPAKRGERHLPSHDQSLYRLRNRVERLISRSKQFRRVLAHYDRTE
jgi:hypothetical protein